MTLNKDRILIIGGGVVGAMLAYELSQRYSQITLLDRQPPAQASTGAALGVLMGAISRKTKGRAWAMRQQSLLRYDALVDELQRQGHQVAYNRHGIVKLLFEEDDRDRWEALAQARREQGWLLHLWSQETLLTHCPTVSLDNPQAGRVTGAVYSGGDRQVHPQQLTLALLEAARAQGTQTHFEASVKSLGERHGRPYALLQSGDRHEADWIIVAAGLGSAGLTQSLPHSSAVDIRPILGQAMEISLESPLDTAAFRPVVTGNDIHIVPLGTPADIATYWVGATVEFPEDGDGTAIEAERQAMWAGAIAMCPPLASAQVLRTWWGKRPRPYGRPAPVIERLPAHPRVIVASGHYRNGVLLAPATAQRVMELMQQ
ncbi:MAG: NAD(P)/FAD-dependent oxidoreductase [Elainellaceae cyanobacterium]